MASSRMNALPALRRQHLLVEFAGLKQACPDGVFVSLTPGDPTLWSGVIFVRGGPYSSAVLRFQISFPDIYPQLPPLVTFSTDMFHPLITPLSTYMYTTDIHDSGTVSATDDERLPPGGFSLRHGFPNWFGRRGRRDTVSSRQSSAQQDGRQTPHRPPPADMSSGGTPISKGAAVGDSPGFADTSKREISTFEVLRYIRSTFDDEDVLDSIPLEAAGNPGAWHAWRTHQMDNGKVFPDSASSGGSGDGGDGGDGGGGGTASTTAAAVSPDSARRPGEWNWEGVWEERVKKGISASLSESVLFGGVGAADDAVSLEFPVNNRTLADAATQIRFLSMEEDDVEAVKDNLLRTLGHTTA
ncbi:ubiquitin-conjugating enzyme/RWD-like protein [Biscogniauxia mediterranea]|nr:ubiquitin-conjugating enzyme/RWD-like protein [Biscogniauxia mediterranea]